MKIFLLNILMLFSVNLFATNYYVSSSTGSNSFNGLTPTTAKQTLSWFSYSTTFLQPGDTIFVMNGTYTNSSAGGVLILRASGSATQPIVVTNYPGHTPLLSFNSWAGINLGDSIHHIVISGLKIKGNNASVTLANALNQPKSCNNPTGTPDPIYNGNGIFIDGRTNSKHVHHITIRNCEIFDCGGGGIVSLQSDYLTYENNLVYNNSWFTIYGASGISNLNTWNYDNHAAIPYSIIIRNNIVYGNELFVPWVGAPCAITDGNGIIIDSQTNLTVGLSSYTGKTLIENNISYLNGGRGIHVYQSDNVDIINNTCFFNGNSSAISDGEITVNVAQNVKVFNNIMYARTGERANYKNSSSLGFSSGNNLIYNYSAYSFTSPTDLIAVNPLFKDTALNNFKLLGSSPAINAGSNNSGEFSTNDINGIARPFNLSADMGAYESQTGTCVTPSSGFTTTNITASTVKVNWNIIAGAISYQIRYRVTGTTPWLKKTTASNVGVKKLTALLASSNYEWQIHTKCSLSPLTWSPWSSSNYFATNALRNANSEIDLSDGDNAEVNIYPNPAQKIFTIEIPENNFDFSICDLTGKKVYEMKSVNKKTEINISLFSNGIYFVHIITENNAMHNRKLIIAN